MAARRWSWAGVIAALGVYHLARGFTRRQLRWAVVATVLLFILAFLSWAATGDPTLPISLTGLVSNSVIASIPFILGALCGIICERSGVINIAIEGQMLARRLRGRDVRVLVRTASASGSWPP